MWRYGGGPSPIDDPTTYAFLINSINFRGLIGGTGSRGGTGNPQDPGKPSMDPGKQSFGTTCPAVPFKVTGVAPGQAPDITAISRTPRADIPNGGVAIKPHNFGVSGINRNNRSVFLGMKFTVDWSTGSPAGAPSGIPTEGPFFPVDNIGPQSVRLAPGNMFDVYNYPSFNQALSSTRTVMVTTAIIKGLIFASVALAFLLLIDYWKTRSLRLILDSVWIYGAIYLVYVFSSYYAASRFWNANEKHYQNRADSPVNNTPPPT